MTRCASEDRDPQAGLGWTPPDPLSAMFETPRLRVRPLHMTDADELREVVLRSKDHLLPWVGWAKTGHRTLADTQAFVAEQQMLVQNPRTLLERGKSLTLAVIETETGRIVGGTGVHDLRTDTASGETGYWIASDATRRGFAAEACRHTISWAFRSADRGGLGLRRLRIYCSDRNEPSRRLLESLGIRKEVEQPEDYWLEGLGATTRLGWGVLAREWDCERHLADPT
ncbi:MAG: GNAT family N-acetyltransferase [Phycisphaerales bacterium]